MDKALDIEQRMISFLEGLSHVTLLDGHIKQPPNVKIADYLFFDRRAVTELKTLKVDPKEKIFGLAASVMESEDFPLIFGDYDLEIAIKSVQGGQAHLDRIFSKATTMVEEVCRQARDQIADSKQLLGLDPETPGILLVLNDTVESIPVSQLVDRFSDRLSGSGKNPGRFSHIDFVILIQTTYRLQSSAGKLVPSFIISNDFNAHRHHKVEADIGRFVESWAHSQGHRYAKPGDIANMQFELNQPSPPPPQSNQDFIEARYRANRYMKGWAEEQLIHHGKDVMQEMLSMVLKGEKRPSETDSQRYMQQFTELLEESRLRGFDLKKILNQMPRAK
ncbi:MAG: hypothetical protein WA173_21195 [Pseudomonas sp.]|uniref:hypothetical protein n=1 Tax=Pseudomonas sp. TaxID=306 RepID=UPI003BB7230D